ncbi:hypothetical protein EPO44_01400 [bacterium]|nr:MAG: hypothetical protein EPO44_01400 [bacterium]
MGQHHDVEQLLHGFRAAAQSISWDSPLRIMNLFPNGCCTFSSFFLGHILQDRNFGKWHIVHGSAGVMKNHDWLESSEGLVVDATADQFPLGIEAFVQAGPSPLEIYFPRAGEVDLSSWSEDLRSKYEEVVAVVDATVMH